MIQTLSSVVKKRKHKKKTVANFEKYFQKGTKIGTGWRPC